MGKRLEVPPELQHLIEKREGSGDRRRHDDRAGGDRRQENVGPLGAIESAEELNDVPTEDRRSEPDRRQQGDRRRANRRSEDS